MQRLYRGKTVDYTKGCSCESCEEITRLDLESQVPLTGLVDEFGFEIPKGESPAAIKNEDLALIRGFLGNLKDQTLSRSIFKVLEALLERLPK